jgi:virulence-associated protein VapD
VLHAKRNDKVTIVATRVPLADVRLQQWGWIITQAYTTEKPPLNGIECLLDNEGRRYPKIYTHTDMQAYVEQWGCRDWEAGYFTVGDVTVNRITAPLNGNVVQEEAFKQAIEDLRAFQEEQTSTVSNAITSQQQVFQNTVNGLINHIVAVTDKMHREMLTVYADKQKHLDELVHDASEMVTSVKDGQSVLPSLKQGLEQWSEVVQNRYQLQEDKLKDILSQTLDLKGSLQNFGASIHTVEQWSELTKNQYQLQEDKLKDVLSRAVEVKNSLQNLEGNILHESSQLRYRWRIGPPRSFVTESDEQFVLTVIIRQRYQLKEDTFREISARSTSLREEVCADTKQHFENFDKDIMNRFSTLFNRIDDIQGREKKILEAVSLEEDDKPDKPTEDIASTIDKALQRAKDPIERMITRQMSVIYGYYKDINGQARDSLKVAHNVVYIGVACIILSLICVPLAIFFFHNVGALIVSGVSAIGALIANATAGVAKLNRTYDKASEQRAYFYGIIERLHRLFMAYEMSQKMPDSAEKQENINKIIDGLIKESETVKQITQKSQTAT